MNVGHGHMWVQARDELVDAVCKKESRVYQQACSHLANAHMCLKGGLALVMDYDPHCLTS